MKDNIWKDPKVELPYDMAEVFVFVKVKKIIVKCTFFKDQVLSGFEDDRGNPYLPSSNIKWCYESDLIKQANE